MPRTRNTHTTPSDFFIAIILMLPFLAHPTLTLRNRRLHVWVKQVVPQLVSASGPAARGRLDHQPERVRRKQQQRGSQRPSSHGRVSAPVSGTIDPSMIQISWLALPMSPPALDLMCFGTGIWSTHQTLWQAKLPVAGCAWCSWAHQDATLC